MKRKKNEPDPALQPHLARQALAGLDTLLTGQRRGESIPTDQVGAIVRLIVQAGGKGQTT